MSKLPEETAVVQSEGRADEDGQESRPVQAVLPGNDGQRAGRAFRVLIWIASLGPAAYLIADRIGHLFGICIGGWAMTTKTGKYRVTFSGHTDHSLTSVHLTRVFFVLECDVIAEDDLQAIKLAREAFTDAFGEQATRSGDWKVRMNRWPHEVENQSTTADRSTIIQQTKMAT